MADSSELVAFPHQPSDRLRLAMRRLETAMNEQAEAVAEFRRAMSDLKEVVQGLQGSVEGYQSTLDRTMSDCQAAQEAAVSAGLTADALIARFH
ncbi:hypothetical protein IAI18_13700 [Acetobacteraceae bacterium H6797]|nr:hypothetical protein [Acetobacteraceae bacterium H6797]